MRHILVLAVLPGLLALAACGYRNFEKPDGTFDRDGYRRLMGSACSLGVMAGDSSIPAETRSRVCGCMMDRMLQMTDDELRATVRDRALGERKQQEAGQACLVQLGLAGAPQPVFDPNEGRWIDPATGTPAGPPPGEPPPPNQPPGLEDNQRTIKDAHSALENATRDAEAATRELEAAVRESQRR